MPDLRWLAATPSPTPTGPPAELVTPGVAGFIAIAVVAIVIVLLAIDMLRRIRRAQYRTDVNEMLDAEEAAAARGEDNPDDGDGPSAVSPEGPAKG
ncbi:hypothetical protein E1I21_07890 [Microbacterium oleivorans]|uniref:Arabinose efflux permease n=1 Tax=Microbacterium oleivorans TaxID=273677 RepID=A0A031FQ30_9MICO|nr:hypothetical protein [Microbacterium oleivorans]AZS44187.1 hypothetical protein BWL13_01772 [Microbacterium oleivorans]EZP26969.1 Arabinose efflux permease [Microbacterium oleivorans]THE07300.1 hypothetical protein E1I21_07890 [Microbacterium oleivorans]